MQFLNIINKFSRRFYFLTPHPYAIGNCSEEIYLGLIKAKEQNKRLFLIYLLDIPFIFRFNLTNKSIFLINSKYIYNPNKIIIIILRILLTLLYIPVRSSSLLLYKLYNVRLDESFSFPTIGRDDLFLPETSINDFQYNLISSDKWNEKYKYRFDILIQNLNKQQMLELVYQLGIPPNAWFVCLHVRESGFRNDKGRREYRNSNINSYIPAINHITSNGGWVVRMGDNSMLKLPKLKNVIDYPHTSNKSELMDLVLIKLCYFFIGTQSGIYDVAVLFNKPILLLNMYSWTFGSPMHYKDRGIIKHVYSKIENRFLSINEIYNSDWSLQNINSIANQDYYFVDNTEQEILDAVREYYKIISEDSFEPSIIQQLAAKELKTHSRQIIITNRLAPNSIMSDQEEMIEKFRYGILIEGSLGHICNTYLNKNWSCDTLNI
jgi:putative glycosyltransferase (TIGR04372 family)